MNGNRKLIGRLALVLPLAALAALVFAPLALAADFREGEFVEIPAGEVIDDDLFVFAQRIEMNGTVTGDLFAFGEVVVVNGTVEGSVFTGAQTLEVNGQVDGSLYGGGYTLTVGPEAAVGRNLYFGGFNLATEAGSTVGRSLYAGSYQVLADGDVARDMRAGVGALELNGRVGGDLVLEVDGREGAGEPPTFFFPNMPVVKTVAPGVRFGPEAEIGGNLWYESAVEQSVPAAAVGGQVTYATPVPQPQPERSGGTRVVVGRNAGLTARLFTAFSTRAGEFIALLIVGALLLRFWPAAVQSVSAQAQERPLRSTGWGLLVTVLFFVAVPLAGVAVFALALLGGLVTFGQLFSAILGLGAAALGLTFTTGLFILALVTKAIVGYVVGRLVLLRLTPQSLTGRWGDLLALALGAGIYEILRAIPLGLGWVIGVVVTLLGVGAIYYVVREALRRPGVPAAPIAA